MTSSTRHEDDIELRLNRGSEDNNFASLPRVDGGKDAWLFLTACFFLEGLVWGFPLAYGVFEDFYTHQPAFEGDKLGVAAVGTTCTGILYFSSPFAYLVLQSHPRIRRPSVYIGLTGIVLALLCASVANNVWQLMLTQGILYGCCGAFPYFAAVLWLDEWFVRRKGLAYGVMWAGTGASGVVMPQVMRWLLETYGYRTALRVSAVSMTVLSVPCLLFLKGRLPTHHSGTGPRRADLTLLKSSTFWILQTGNIIEGLGVFLPSLYLPSYARSLNLPSFAGTLALSLINLATIAGAIIIGLLIDRFHVTTAIMTCTIGATVSIFLFWGFATQAAAQPLLYIFALLYGIFGGGFSATWAGCASAIRRRYQNVETGFVIALLAAGRGVGAVASGPLSAKLLQADSWKGEAAGAYGSGFGSLVVFTGITAACGGLSWIGRRFGFV